MPKFNFAKWRHTIMFSRQYDARSYADYGAGNHRWHIHRHHVVLRAVLCAAIFTKFGCAAPYMLVHAK